MKIILTMKKLRIIVLSSLVITILSNFIYADDYDSYKKINYPFSMDGKEYILTTSDDYYNLLIIDKNNQKTVFHQENFLFDGIYILEEIKVKGNSIIITAMFDGAGHQKREIHYMKVNDEFVLIKQTFSDVDRDNYSRIRVCDIFIKNNKEECFYEIIRSGYLYFIPNKISDLRLEKGDRVKLLREKTDHKNNKWYLVSCESKNNMIMWIKNDVIDYN